MRFNSARLDSSRCAPLLSFLASFATARKRTKYTTSSTASACPPNAGPYWVCPEGYNYDCELQHCCKVIDSLVDWGCIVGTYDKETEACVTPLKRLGELKCPNNYTLRGLLCEPPPKKHHDCSDYGKCDDLAQDLGGAIIPRIYPNARLVPKAASVLATVVCREDETPDALDGTCTFSKRWPRTPVCAGEVIRNLDGELLCRVIHTASKIAICSYGSIAPTPTQLDILNSKAALMHYYLSQPPLYLEDTHAESQSESENAER